MPSSTSCLAFESQQGAFLLGLILLSLYLPGERCDIFSNRALSFSSGGQSKGQARTCIVLGVSIFGVSLTSNSSGGTPHLALGILSSSSIF